MTPRDLYDEARNALADAASAAFSSKDHVLVAQEYRTLATTLLGIGIGLDEDA